jgi:hypothetical protein
LELTKKFFDRDQVAQHLARMAEVRESVYDRNFCIGRQLQERVVAINARNYDIIVSGQHPDFVFDGCKGEVGLIQPFQGELQRTG